MIAFAVILKVMLCKRPETGGQPQEEQKMARVPIEYAPIRLTNILRSQLQEAFQSPENVTPTATLTFVNEQKEITGKPRVDVLLISYPKNPTNGLVFPGGAITTDEEPIRAAWRELGEELAEVQPEFPFPEQKLNELFMDIRKRLEQSMQQVPRESQRFFALTGRETGRQDLALDDTFFKVPLSNTSKRRDPPILHEILQQFAQRFSSLPLPPISPIITPNPYKTSSGLAKVEAFSLVHPDLPRSVFCKLEQISEELNSLRPEGAFHFPLEQTQTIINETRSKAEALQSGFQEYLNQYGNILGIFVGPQLKEKLSSDSKQATALQDLEQKSRDLIERLWELKLTIQIINLQHMINEILGWQPPLKYPADSALLAMLALYWPRGSRIPDQYIAYLPSNQPLPEVIVATELPDHKQPILIHISPEPPYYPPGAEPITSVRQRLWSKVYLLDEETYQEIKTAVKASNT